MTVRTRFSLSYFLLFASVGILFNYYALYLERVGLTGTQIGVVLGTMALARTLPQPFWGMIGDIYRKRRLILTIACFSLALLAPALTFSVNFGWLLAVTIVMSVMNSPVGPFSDALSLEFLEREGRRQEFGSLRLWGSVGFAVTSFIVGAFVIGPAIGAIVYLYSIAMALMGIVTITLPDVPHGDRVSWNGGGAVLRENPRLVRFLLAAIILGTTLGVANSYLIVYLTHIGAAGWISGLTFALGGLLEVPLMALGGYFIGRWGLRAVLFGGLSIQPLRWLLYLVIATPLLVPVIQIIHSIAMLSLLIVGVLFVDQQLAPQWRASGQTLYAAALHGIGQSIGLFAAGAIYEYSGINNVWWACVAASCLGLVVLAWAIWAPIRGDHGSRILRHHEAESGQESIS